MLVSLQIATAAIGTAAVSNSIEHTKAAARITTAYKLKWAVKAAVRTVAIIATTIAGVQQVLSSERSAARRCSLAYSIMQC